MITKISQSFKMAMASIFSNKVRLFLTMLGIIIGVGSVILLIGLGDGSKKSINDKLSSFGTNLITVNVRARSGTRTVTAEEMFDFAAQNKDIINGISPYVSSNSVTAKVGTANKTTTMEGVSDIYLDVKSLELGSGKYISSDDLNGRKNVAVVGTFITKEYFGGASPIGKQIKLNGVAYDIIGVLKEQADSTENSADNKVQIPYNTAMRILKIGSPTTYFVQAVSTETVEVATNSLKNYLISKIDKNSITVISQKQMLETMDSIIGMLNSFLVGIAAISLVVAGIGIMNIMMVSVTERTKEIGIRKAIGARRSDILMQFLIESVVVSCLGGLMGILLGIGLGSLATLIPNVNFVSKAGSILLSFSFSFVVGVVFGLYPAVKASKLNPIDALRYE